MVQAIAGLFDCIDHSFRSKGSLGALLAAQVQGCFGFEQWLQLWSQRSLQLHTQLLLLK
jgi:hypothetical protein